MFQCSLRQLVPQLQLLFQHHCHGRSSIRRCSNIYAPCSSPITIELWDSILDYFFINHTLRPGTLARRSPFRSSHQLAELLSEVDSLHRINRAGSSGSPRRCRPGQRTRRAPSLGNNPRRLMPPCRPRLITGLPTPRASRFLPLNLRGTRIYCLRPEKVDLAVPYPGLWHEASCGAAGPFSRRASPST